MIDRITLMIAAVLLALLVGKPATADDANDQQIAAERQQAAETFQRIRKIEQAKIRVEQAAAFNRGQFELDVIGGEPEEDFVDELLGDVAPSIPAAQVVSDYFDYSIFGSLGSREDFVRRLEKILQSKVEGIDRGCKLTDSQRLRLLLAGRGDMKRLFDRIDDSRRQFVGMEIDRVVRLRGNPMQVSAQELQPLVRKGPFDDNSLFVKIMQRTLTAEQVASLIATTEIERLGGRVTRRAQTGNALSDVHFTATALTDEGLAKTKSLPNLRMLALEITRITDAGLIHVAGQKSLEVLDLCGTRITGAGLVHLKELPNLQILMLRNTSVDDAGLVHLRGLANLKELLLQGTQVTDAGLLHLVPLRQLELLNLGRTRVTDAGLVTLDFPARATLRELGLAHTGITDAGLARVKVLTGLERLYLNGTQITDTGLAELAGLKKLQSLYLDDTQITDAGLAHLQELTELEHLDLGGTRVSDAGLARIRGLQKLKHLDLANTRVTNAGVADLQRALPDVVVIR